MQKSDGPDSPGDDWLQSNRAVWGERGAMDRAGEDHALAALGAFRRGEDTIRDFVAAEVGDVTGKSLLHLQCHIGVETLSWARRGAHPVVGLDISEPAVDAARELAAESGFTADRAAFVAADLYDAAEAVPDASYDIVVAGPGALSRLPDIPRWAEIAAALVAPGGFLHLAEIHPLADTLDDETGARLVRDSFGADAWADESPDPYAGLDAPVVPADGAGWGHPVGELVSALAAAGLRIDFVHEHDATVFQRLTSSRGGDGLFRRPQDRPRIPLMYSVRAFRP
ncbi:methyltransferase [Streptomyces sp. NPDC051776]|uniref:class I SAM-dependent methyltransferase n=1 Tax=Streptomyces sp. NPDC051776 TaxID=3155414 RepID=UPI003420B77D